jgi:hypothetical protein
VVLVRSVWAAAVVAITVTACQPAAPEPDAGSDVIEPAGQCWTLQYEEANPVVSLSDGSVLPPSTIRIWTDSTFPNSEGLLQVEAAPGFEQTGGGMMSRISSGPDSVELTWAGATSSTHYRFEVFTDSMSGTAWHHGEAESASDARRRVTAYPAECQRL